MCPVQAQSTTTPLPPEAQEAYERGYAAAEQGEWGLAIKYFSEAQKAAPESPEVLFNLAFACSNAGGRDILAIAWYRAYLAAAPDAPNAAEVRKEIINREVKVEANINELFRLAKDAAAEITYDHYKSEAYIEIATKQAETGDIAGAKDSATEIPEHRDKPWVYSKIAEVQAETGDIAGARDTAAGITDNIYKSNKSENRRAKSNAYSKIAKKQAETGDIAGARESLALAKKVAESMKDDDDKSSAYETIAAVQPFTGDIAGARDTAENIRSDYYKSEAYSNIARYQVKTGDIASARESLALAKKAAAGITDNIRKSGAYERIVKTQATIDIVSARETATARANEPTPAKVKYEASAEIKSWTGLAITYRQKQLFRDIQGFLKSLNGDKNPRDVAKNLTKAAGNMADALKELQDNEVKWSELRAKSTP
ncbi:MAG: tetratricopeptide repeat protein [Candidatus Brocadiales bacterium]|nr:tetratricopeptide repeat protein [Candidatus Bathyanammoxibius sp.]